MELGTSGDKEELRTVFSKYGHLTNVWIATNPPGFAYIFYRTFEDAEKAVEHTNGKKVCGVTVRVELSPIEDKYRQQNNRFGSRDRDDGGGGNYQFRQNRDGYHGNRFTPRGRGRGGGGFRPKGGMQSERGYSRGYPKDDYQRRRGGGGGGFRGKPPSRGYGGRGGHRGPDRGGRDYNEGYSSRGGGGGRGRRPMGFSPSPSPPPHHHHRGGGGMRRSGGGGFRDERGGGSPPGRYHHREDFEHKPPSRMGERRGRREHYEDEEYWPALSPRSRSPRSPPPRGPPPRSRRPDHDFREGRGRKRESRGGRREHEVYEGEGDSRGYVEIRSHRGGEAMKRRSYGEEEHRRGRRSGGHDDYYVKDSHQYRGGIPHRDEYVGKSLDYHPRGSGHDREDLRSSSGSRYRKDSFLSPDEHYGYHDRSPSPRSRSPVHYQTSSSSARRKSSPPHHRSHHHHHHQYYKSSGGGHSATTTHHIYSPGDGELMLRRKSRSVSSRLSSASRSLSRSPSPRGTRSRSLSHSSTLPDPLEHPYSPRSPRSRSRSRSPYSDYTPPPPPLGGSSYHSPLGGSGYEPVDTYQTEDSYESRRFSVDDRRVKYSPRSRSSSPGGHSSFEGENGKKSLREIKYKGSDRLVEIGSKERELRYDRGEMSRREKRRHYSFSPVAEHRGRGISPPSRRRNSPRRGPKKRMAPTHSRSRSRSPH